jgi:hypothetical protein
MAVDQKIIDSLVQQILATSDSSKWGGEGKGSAKANATDMANILAKAGITDVKQLGVKQEVIPAMYGEGLNEPERVVNKYFNKATGKELDNTYGERQIGNFFGGTYTGKGNTGYGVVFDAQGNPQFFTSGASSSDLTKDTLLALGVMGGIGLLNGLGTVGTEGLLSSVADMSGLAATEAGALGTEGLLSGAGGAINAAGAEGLLSGAALPAGMTTAELALGTGAATGALTNAATTGALTNAATTAATTGGLGSAASNLLSNIGSTASNLLSQVPAPVTNAVVGGLLSGLTGSGAANLISGGLGTAGNLLQMQQSREATQQAQARIDAETAAAKQAAQFRPVGMTTRFGTSNFTYDPVTGQMVSAGYQLTPEAKAQQDRLMALSNQGLTQAEQAQAQFAPLQTGAQSLFSLGNQYLAQSPEEVAQRYISQQMNLLQPGRELELANLQNRLQQQGRSGLAVAQGGNYGATTPELQALYNARAMQEAQLAANAQQAGQQQVSFGAGLLGQGAGAMGQYYAGQQAAYAPYTTAMGQVQNLEAQGQQPLGLSSSFAQQQAQAGANAGRLGLSGAQLSAGLATSADATRNLAAQSLIAAGNPNAMFGQTLGQLATGLFGGQQGTGVAGNPLAVGEYANPGYWT